MKRNGASQYLMLTTTNFSSIGLALITNIIITSLLSESDYGSYKYVLNIIIMIVSLTNLGVYYSTARLLTKSDVDRERALYGATISIMFFIYLVVGIMLFIVISISNKFTKVTNNELMLAIPLVYTIMFQRTFMYMLKGSNKIFDMCIQTIMPQMILIIVYVVIALCGLKTISFENAIFIYAISFSLTHIFTILRLKVVINKRTIKEIKNIINEQKTNGFEIYKGSLFAVFTADMLNVIIGTISSKSSYGAYSLALSFSTPIMQIPSIMGIIRFKKNASSEKLDSKEIKVTSIISIICYSVLNIGLYILFPIIYKGKYEIVPVYTLFLSLGYILHGMGDYLNNFLNSKGRGKEIKKGSVYCGIVQVLLAYLLVPLYGIPGVIVARIVSSTIYFISMILGYYKAITIRNVGESYE